MLSQTAATDLSQRNAPLVPDNHPRFLLLPRIVISETNKTVACLRGLTGFSLGGNRVHDRNTGNLQFSSELCKVKYELPERHLAIGQARPSDALGVTQG